MRIALVHMRHAHSGGTERYLDQLSTFLANSGHAVTIVCRTHVETPHPSIRFEVLRPVSIGGAWRMWAFAQAVESFLKVRGRDFDVVFGLGKTWTHDVMRLGGGVQRTYLELAHDATLEGWERILNRGALKQRIACAIENRALAAGAARKWICNSEMVRRDVLAHFGLPRDDVVVVHNGVDLERFHPQLCTTAGADLRRSLGFEPHHLVVLFLGTGYGRKGLDRLLTAFASVHRERADARLLVVGYDSALARYRNRAHELGLDDASRFLGGRSDVEACYAAADVYVLPTFYDPFANSTLEALATGLPVITTVANGGAELLTSGSDGQIVESHGEELRRALFDWTDTERVAAARPLARALAEKHGHDRAMREALAVLRSAVGT